MSIVKRDANGKVIKERPLPQNAIFAPTARYEMQVKLDAAGVEFTRDDDALVFRLGPSLADMRYLPINHVIPKKTDVITIEYPPTGQPLSVQLAASGKYLTVAGPKDIIPTILAGHENGEPFFLGSPITYNPDLNVCQLARVDSRVDAQRWVLTESTKHPGYYYITSQNCKGDLAVFQKNNKNQGLVGTSSRDDDQVWKLTPAEERGYWHVESWVTGYYLGLPMGLESTDKARLCQLSKSDKRQTWRFDK